MILYKSVSVISIIILVIFFFFVIRVILYKTGLIHIMKKLRRTIEDCFHVYQFFKVPEFNESMQQNLLYRKISLYLCSLKSIEDSDFTNLVAAKNPNDVVLCLDHKEPKQIIEDHFIGARVFWLNEENFDAKRSRVFLLKIRRADKRRILRPYLQHIHNVANEIEKKCKWDLKLYVNTPASDGGIARWRSVPFTHPSTFETITMEPDLKNKIKSDLESFLKAKQYYHRLGRVWKRSFLLYGPSGTGKSSFIAAMANFLCYDVYDINLFKIQSDSDLKSLLLQTTPKSIVVVEDLDRFLTEKSPAISLPGMLNFMDGILSSSIAQQQIFVYTVNINDVIDPGLLRPGRVDVHIHFPLCDFSGFKTLASNCLGLKDHKLFPLVEEIFQSGLSLSPAEIGELMIVNRNSPGRAIKSVVNALQTNGDGRKNRKIGRQMEREQEEFDESDGMLCSVKLHRNGRSSGIGVIKDKIQGQKRVKKLVFKDKPTIAQVIIN